MQQTYCHFHIIITITYIMKNNRKNIVHQPSCSLFSMVQWILAHLNQAHSFIHILFFHLKDMKWKMAWITSWEKIKLWKNIHKRNIWITTLSKEIYLQHQQVEGVQEQWIDVEQQEGFEQRWRSCLCCYELPSSFLHKLTPGSRSGFQGWWVAVIEFNIDSS